MTFEEFLYEKADAKDVAWVENWIENLDLEDIFTLADEYAIKEKEKLIKRIEKGMKNDL